MSSHQVVGQRLPPSFNFPSLFKRALEEEAQRLREENLKDLSTLSPLSTPPSSPFLSSSVPASLHEINKVDTDCEQPSNARAQQRENRKRKRQELDIASYTPPPNGKRRHVESSKPRYSVIRLENIRVSEKGFTGYAVDLGENVQHSLQDLVGPNSKFKMTLIEWDGSYSVPIVSADGYIIVILLSNPRDAQWQL
ncbi:hypothetical protein MPER_03319, partial [Moniliophthora perniciosa FA553]